MQHPIMDETLGKALKTDFKPNERKRLLKMNNEFIKQGKKFFAIGISKLQKID